MVWQGGDKQITAGQILERKFAPNAHCSKPGYGIYFLKPTRIFPVPLSSERVTHNQRILWGLQ